MDALGAALRDLLLYALVVLAWLGPVEAFLRLRRRAAGSAYVARRDPWVSAVVVLAGGATVALVSALS